MKDRISQPQLPRRLSGEDVSSSAAVGVDQIGSIVHGCITAEFPCGVSASCYRCFIEHEKKKKPSPSAGNINIFMNISAFHSLLLHDKIILNANEFYFIITWLELWSRRVQEP